MTIQITVDIGNVAGLREAFGDVINQVKNNAALRIQQELVHLTPRDKYGRGDGPGRLQASFTATPSTTGIILRWGARHAKYPDLGVAPHIMRSDTGIPTPYGVFKKINHPGQQPQNYRFNVAQAAQQIIKEEIERAMMVTFG